MTQLPDPARMYRATLERDSSYDGVFFLGVRTTGVFCRPSCPARKPREENVEYFVSVDAARAAGFRPCKRCRPLALGGPELDEARGILASLELAPHERLSDADLRERSIDPVRARRAFRASFGMTFHAWQRTRRLGLALQELRAGRDRDVTAARFGWESPSGFAEAFERLFGAPPTRASSEGDLRECLFVRVLASPVGPLLAGATARGICLLEFADRPALKSQATSLRASLGCAVAAGTTPHLDQLARELAEWFAGRRKQFGVPLELRGTAFERQVWQRLLEIPYGATLSYEALARGIGRPGAQRAVGRANGKNRIAILVPCHRVVQKNGELRGYGGGLWRKKFLLDLEAGQARPELTDAREA
jgi:AraC family transcriptional regulator, regulatory protein of adaptative response / methylated-DNA-[protein]-cysteine methyltransferase